MGVAALTAFLAARLDEDEAAAKAEPYPEWKVRRSREVWESEAPTRPGWRAPACRAADGDWTFALHAARHDPARVLREVQAKRAIVTLHRLDDRPAHYCWECDEREWPCLTLRALAVVWSDHEDYDPAWGAL